jgi:hypothetical protein
MIFFLFKLSFYTNEKLNLIIYSLNHLKIYRFSNDIFKIIFWTTAFIYTYIVTAVTYKINFLRTIETVYPIFISHNKLVNYSLFYCVQKFHFNEILLFKIDHFCN